MYFIWVLAPAFFGGFARACQTARPVLFYGMNLMRNLLYACWDVTAAMAPYLLFGFLVSGLIRIVLTPAWIRRHLGRAGLWQIVKAALIGVPLPLCSCGVIPVGLSLRRQGASRGATAAFLAATPQTGVDSIAATLSLLGMTVTVIRVIAAFFSGLLAGVLVEWAYPPETQKVEEPESSDERPQAPWWKRVWEHGFITLPRDMARPFLLGILIAGLLTVLVPPDYFKDHLFTGWRAYAVMLAIGIPLYVCSTASIPLAVGFVHMGFSPGAALVFLVAGPATNAATISVLWNRIGRKGAVLYLVAIAISAVAAGLATDLWLKGSLAGTVVPHLGHGEMGGFSPLSVAAALFMLALVIPGLWNREEED